jgi:hypothetical protein
MFEVFGKDVSQYEAEAKERWGSTDAYRESARRTKQYTKAQWQEIKDEAERITLDLAAVLDGGLSATDAAAMDVAERHRRHIERWFYPCGPAMHAGLGQLYVDDPRFAATYEAVRPGLAAFARDAWQANAQRGEADGK